MALRALVHGQDSIAQKHSDAHKYNDNDAFHRAHFRTVRAQVRGLAGSRPADELRDGVVQIDQIQVDREDENERADYGDQQCVDDVFGFDARRGMESIEGERVVGDRTASREPKTSVSKRTAHHIEPSKERKGRRRAVVQGGSTKRRLNPSQTGVEHIRAFFPASVLSCRSAAS